MEFFWLFWNENNVQNINIKNLNNNFNEKTANVFIMNKIYY